jgi:hypothetical protein
MKGLFPQYDYTASMDYAEAWENAIFVFDTNVLLNLYRYQERTREELLETLAKLGDRIWIPYHVALEFQRNRLTVIAAQGRRFSDIQKVIEKAKSDLGSSINNLQLTKRHALIDPEPLTTGFGKLADDFLAKLEKLKKSQQSLTDPDPIKIRLEDIFDGKVGSAFNSQKEIDDQHNLAESRYKAKIPPGYKDADKDKDGPDDFSHNGLNYKRKYGDHMVWNQLLSHAAQQGVKKLIFITDDVKEDWWQQIEFDGPKTVGPRAELIEEASRIGNIDTFLMYRPEGFLKYASEFLSAKISEETLTEVHDVSLENKMQSRSPEDIKAQEAQTLASVLSWVHDKHDMAFMNDEEFPDIFGLDDINFHGYEVKFFRGRSISLYKDILRHSIKSMATHSISALTIVFIVSTPVESRMILDALEKISIASAPDNLHICIGRLTYRGGEFRPVQEFKFNDLSNL